MKHKFNYGDKIKEMNSGKVFRVLDYHKTECGYTLQDEDGRCGLYTADFIEAHYDKVGKFSVSVGCEKQTDDLLLQKMQDAVATVVCKLRNEYDALQDVNGNKDYITTVATNMLIERGIHLMMEEMGWRFFYYNGEVTFVEMGMGAMKKN